MKKVFNLLLVGLFCFLVFSALSKTNIQVEAYETLEEMAAAYTNDDNFKYYTDYSSIQSYSESAHKYKNNLDYGDLFAATVSFGIAYYNVQGDDAIVEIIPKSYFCFEGTTTYIGKEYGFFIKTVKETYYDGIVSGTTSNYRSYVIVFDIINSTNLAQNTDRAIFTVKVLFSMEFIAINENESYIWRKFDAMDTEHLNDNYDYVMRSEVHNYTNEHYTVVPLFDMNDYAFTNRYYLNDISFAGNLQNEQDYNTYDSYYSANNDIGSYFTRLDYYFDGKCIVKGSFSDIDFGSMIKMIITDTITTGLSYIPVIGNAISTVLTVAFDTIDIIDTVAKGLADKEYDVTNNTCVAKVHYVNRDEQIKYYGYLIKCAYLALNTNSDASILYEDNDYAQIEYTIGHSALGIPASNTRITNEIALKVVDRYSNVVSTATSSHDFQLREPTYKELSIGSNNNLILLNNGINYFSFTPEYSGKYLINIPGTENVRMTFDDIVKEGSNFQVQKELDKGRNYKIKIENLTNKRICLSFDFMVSTDMENITVYRNNNYLIRLSSVSGFKSISFDNQNTKLILMSEKFATLKDNGLNKIHYALKDPVYYILIVNNTNNNLSGNLVIDANFSQIYLNSTTNISLTKGEQFYKFNPYNTATYSIIIFENNASDYDFALYSDKGKVSTVVVFGSNYVKYDFNLSSGETYYIGYENCNYTQGELSMIIKQKDNVYSFYIDGNLVTGDIYMLQGEMFKFEVKIDDKLINDIEVISLSGNSPYITKRGEYYVIDEDAPTTNSYAERLAVIDINHNSLEYITIFCLPSFSINIDNYAKRDTNTCNQLEWQFDSSNINNYAIVTLELTFTNNVKHTFDIIVGKGKNVGYVDVPSINLINLPYGSQKAVATAKIIKIVFTHHWQSKNSSDYDEYQHTFTNSYPDEPIIAEKQFKSNPITINMLFNGGTGTISNPYLIINEWQLNNIRYCDSEYREEDQSHNYLRKYFAIVNDIILKNDWEPIDPPMKEGKIYGYGNSQITISNLIISEVKTTKNIGFIRDLYGGTIENLNFTGAQITVKNSREVKEIGIGVVAGGVTAGTISNCTVNNASSIMVGGLSDNTSLIGAKYTNTGGICGIGHNIYDCTNEADIESYGNIGGIAGNIYSGTVSNCTNKASLTLMHNNISLLNDNENKSVGGIIGVAYMVSFKGLDKNYINSGAIIYKSNGKLADPFLSPRMGWIAGTVYRCTDAGNLIGDRGKDNSQTTFNTNYLIDDAQKQYTGCKYGLIKS